MWQTVITKRVRYYKVWQTVITKWVRYYRVWQTLLQSATVITKWDVTQVWTIAFDSTHHCYSQVCFKGSTKWWLYWMSATSFPAPFVSFDKPTGSVLASGKWLTFLFIFCPRDEFRDFRFSALITGFQQ